MSGLKVFVHYTQPAVLVQPIVGVHPCTKFRNVEALPDWMQEAMAVLDMVPHRQMVPNVGYRTEGPVRQWCAYALVYKGVICLDATTTRE